MRFGTVALIGRSNVGKSTLLNAALGESLAITSRVPQTTRDVLLGVAHHQQAQIAFLDTPGLHQPKSELGRRMNLVALEAARQTDCIIFMTDTRSLIGKQKKSDPISAQDRALLQLLPQFGNAPALLVINKVDLLRDKSRLIPMLEAFNAEAKFASSVPVSAIEKDGVDRVLSEVSLLMPETEALYDQDTLTDRPTRFFLAEFIREQVLHLTGREVPHAVAVSIDQVDESAHSLKASATIHVQKQGQRAIVVGRAGTMIREIGMGARQRLAQLIGKEVHLNLFVRVTPRWKDVPRQLSELGYDAAASREVAGLQDTVEKAFAEKKSP